MSPVLLESRFSCRLIFCAVIQLRPSESWGEMPYVLTFCHSHVPHFSWDPRHTPFSQLVHEMVDMDIQILQRGSNIADIPADTAVFPVQFDAAQ